MADGTDEAYEAFAGLYRRRRRSGGWRATGWIGTGAWWRGTTPCSSTPRPAIAPSWRNIPDSDLTATARKLEERLRNRPEFTPAVAAANAAVPQNVALAGPTCPCNVQPPQQQPLKVNAPVRRVEPDPPKKRVDRKPPRARRAG